MIRRRLAAVALAAVCVSANGATGDASQRTPTVQQLLDRSTIYVEDFVTRFARVVAEEQYLQEYLDASPEGSRGSFPGAPKVRERRTLKSDLLLVKPIELDQWLIFRDVFEVNGYPVRDRENRLTKLFLETADRVTAIERARQISDASAQFNVRAIGTVDHPLLAIGFLQRAYRDRFRFTLRGPDRSSGPDAWIVEYRETARPTVIRGSDDKDAAAHGRYWIDATSGRVIRTEVVFNALGTESSNSTAFAFDDQLGAHVPTEMRFRRSVASSEVRGVATYGRFRQFEVATEERIQK